MPAILPLATLLVLAGLIAQVGLWSQTIHGAGATGTMDALATGRAQAAEVFASACVEAALEAGDVVSSSITVTLPTGVIAPSDAVCETTSASSGLNVYAWVPTEPGAAARIRSDTSDDMSWYLTTSAGTGVNLSTGASTTLPSSIPSGYLVDWVIIYP